MDILTTRSVSWRSEDRFGQQDGECNHQLALTIENINPDWGD